MSQLFNRRSLLKSVVAVPCAVAGYFIYKRIKHGDGTIRTIGAPDLPKPVRLPPAPQSDSYNFFAIGDTGLASKSRQAVLKQLQKQSRQNHTDSIFLVGDNFYDKGVESTSDPQWKLHFEKPFAEKRFPFPFYPCLGNHDYYGNVAAQIEYSEMQPRWKMPGLYYTFEKHVGKNCKAQFFVLDTTPIEEGDHSTQSQVKWLRNKLKTSSANYKIVVGHHPLFTGGEHGRSHRNFKHLAEMFDRNGVDLYICGHDHDLQLHDTGRGWLHIVSGAGSKLRSVRWTDTTMFAKASPGFFRISLRPDLLGIEAFSHKELLYSHSIKRKSQRIRSAA